MKRITAGLEEKCSEEALRKGAEYYQKGRVEIYAESSGSIQAWVREARVHHGRMKIDYDRDSIVCDCTCGVDSNTYCRHMVAAFLHIKHEGV